MTRPIGLTARQKYPRLAKLWADFVHGFLCVATIGLTIRAAQGGDSFDFMVAALGLYVVTRESA